MPKVKSKPTPIASYGRHNDELAEAILRLQKGKAYKDCSTICVMPTRGVVPMKVVTSWMGLMTPMNQKFMRLPVIGMEVGAAYEWAIEQILANDELKKWKYVLTLEEDNMPPPDGLLKLVESIDGGVDSQKYDVMGGLYWTKGGGGQPMIYGDPQAIPLNFMPQLPIPDAIQRCRGLGMGFTLFRLDLFRKVPRPWFKTEQSYEPGVGVRAYTQDLYFFEKAQKAGAIVASDNRVKVGHYALAEDIVW